MARLTDVQRVTLGYWWNLLTDAAKNLFSSSSVIEAVSTIAKSADIPVTFDTYSAVSHLYGYANRMQHAADAFQAATNDQYINADMIATAPWSREQQEMNDYPIWHVRFEYTYIDAAGNQQTEMRTDAIKLTLPGTIGDLIDRMQPDIDAMAAKYGHQLISFTPTQILAV